MRSKETKPIRRNYMVTIRFSEYGTLLSTRSLAAEIASCIEKAIDEQGSASLDFGDVSMVSLSFSDELFARLIKRYEFEGLKSKTHLVNLSGPIKTIVSQGIGMNVVSPLVNTVKLDEAVNLRCI